MTRVAVVDLRAGRVTQVRNVPGAQPLLPVPEVLAAGAAAAADS